MLVGQAEVAMAGGLRDHRAGRIDAGTGKEFLVDGAFESEGGTADVADGGETAE